MYNLNHFGISHNVCHRKLVKEYDREKRDRKYYIYMEKSVGYPYYLLHIPVLFGSVSALDKQYNK